MDSKEKKPAEKKRKERTRSVISYTAMKRTAFALMIVAALFAILRTSMVLDLFEQDVQYFKYGSALPTVFNIALTVFFVVAVIIPMLPAKREFPAEYKENAAGPAFFALLCAVSLCVYGVTLVKELIERRSQGEMFIASAQNFTARYNVVSILSAVFAVFGVIYFVVTAVRPQLKTARVFLGIGLTGFFICRLLALYFNTASPINSPIKTLDQLALAAAMLFMVSELRFLASEPRQRFYISMGLTAFALMFPSSVSQLAALVRGFDPNTMNGLPFAVFELILSCYVAVKLLTYLVSGRSKLIPDPVFAEEPQTDGTAEG